MHHNRLIAVVLAINVAVAWYGVDTGWWSGSAVELATIAVVAQANFVLAVLPRQPHIVNLAGWLATRPRSSRSVRVRWAVGKYYHLGGVHVGAALAGTAWYLAYVVSSTVDLARGAPTVSGLTVALALAVVVVFVVICLMALPRARARDHDRFEATHRLGAWSALALVWAGTVASTRLRSPGTPLVLALIETPTVWLLALTTVLAIWPWLLLRRVPITVHRPSLHAVVVHLDHDIRYRVGTTRGDQPPPDHRVAPLRRRPPGRWRRRLSDGRVTRGRLDRCVHRRHADPRVGARRPGGGRRQRAAAVQQGRVRRDRQRDRTRARSPARRRGSDAAGVGHAASRGGPTATGWSTRCSPRSRTP